MKNDSCSLRMAIYVCFNSAFEYIANYIQVTFIFTKICTMHPGQIEVNEINGYWTFLLSVRYSPIYNQKSRIRQDVTIFADRLEGSLAYWPYFGAYLNHHHCAAQPEQLQLPGFPLPSTVYVDLAASLTYPINDSDFCMCFIFLSAGSLLHRKHQ